MKINIRRQLAGITQGHRWQVHPYIKKMNSRVLESHNNAPWNRPHYTGIPADEFEDWEGEIREDFEFAD